MKRKQYTIIMPGNRFGEYLSDTMEGYYTRWTVIFDCDPDYEEYEIFDVKVRDINLSKDEMKMRDINRTFDYFAEVHDAERSGYPCWLTELRNEVYGKYKLSR